MRVKSPKTYTLAQVKTLLGVSLNSVYNYVTVGLIKVTPRAPGTKEGRTVTEAEYLRLKRDGVDTTGLKAALAKHGTAGKKRAKRATATAAKTAARKR